MEIALILQTSLIRNAFKIDLIVWKLCYWFNTIIYIIVFKIDLIVWKL